MGNPRTVWFTFIAITKNLFIRSTANGGGPQSDKRDHVGVQTKLISINLTNIKPKLVPYGCGNIANYGW